MMTTSFYQDVALTLLSIQSTEASEEPSPSEDSEDSEPQDRKSTKPAGTAKSGQTKAPATITGGKLTASRYKPKKPATKKRAPTVDGDDSVPSDSSDDGKLNLSKVKKTIDHHARWCPFIRINKKLMRVYRNERETRALLNTLVGGSEDDDDDNDERETTKPVKAKTTKAQGPKPNAATSKTAKNKSSEKQADEGQAEETRINEDSEDENDSEEEVAGANSATANTQTTQKKVAFQQPADEGESAHGGANLRALSTALLSASQMSSDSDLSSLDEEIADD